MFWNLLVNKYLFYEEIRTKTRPFLNIHPLMKYSVQQQIHFNGNVFGNKCCRCNEGSLYEITGRVSAVPPASVLVRRPLLELLKFKVHGPQRQKTYLLIYAPSEEFDQTARMQFFAGRRIWVFNGHICQKVRFLTLRFLWFIWQNFGICFAFIENHWRPRTICGISKYTKLQVV